MRRRTVDGEPYSDEAKRARARDSIRGERTRSIANDIARLFVRRRTRRNESEIIRGAMRSRDRNINERA